MKFQFEKLERVVIGLYLILALGSPFLKTRVIISISENIQEFFVYSIIEDDCQSVRVDMSVDVRVESRIF